MQTSHHDMSNDEISAADYLRPITSRKWMLLAIVVMVTIGTFAYHSRQPKVYEASTKIFVGSDAGALERSVVPSSDRTIENQATLLKSREVAENVARRLGRPGHAGELAASVEALASTGSDFVLVQARRGDAQDAALVANSFAREFVRLTDQRERAEINRALGTSQRQLDRLPGGSSHQAERAQLDETIRRLQLELAVPAGSARQIDPALPPSAAVEPQPARNALFGFALSLLVTIGLAFGLERFDRRVKRVEDMTGLYDLPVLGVLPHVEERAFSVKNEPALGPAFEEAFRQLRTNIQLAAIGQPFKSIIVTSAESGEGKSTVVRNLAIAFREWGNRVAVLDADLRRPTLATLFGQEHGVGMTDVLTCSRSLDDTMLAVKVRARGLETLAQMKPSSAGEPSGANGAVSVADEGSGVISLLCSGPLPANPQALLAADRTHLLLDTVGQQHDIVLIDSPPLLAVSDVVPLLPEADAVIIVSRLGLTTRDAARRLSEFLKRIPEANAIGVVVNDLDAVGGRSYYGYYGYNGRA